MQVVVGEKDLQEIRDRGGAVYVWPCKLCCGGTYVLDASFNPPRGEHRLAACEPLRVFTPPDMRLPRELHLELGRKGRVRAYWDGLPWIL